MRITTSPNGNSRSCVHAVGCVALAVMGLVGSLVSAGSASAAVYTWSGSGTNALWNTGSNWVGNVAPVTGNDLLFNNSTRLSPNTNNITGLNLGTITFGNSAGAFSISGSAISLGSIVNSSNNDQTLSLTVNQVTSGTYNAVTKDIILSGTFTGSGNVSKIGNGALVLSGNKSGYTGLIDVSAGTLELRTNGNLSGGSVKLAANTTLKNTNATSLKSLELAGTGITLPSGQFNFASGTFSNTSGSEYAIGNTLIFTGTSTFAVGAGITLSGQLNGSGASNVLTKTGTGTLELLNSSNSYSGAFNLDAGTLKLDGGLTSAAVSAAAGTTITTSATNNAFAVDSLVFAAGVPVSNLTPGGDGGIGGFGSNTDITLSSNTIVGFDIQGSGSGAGNALTDYDSVLFAVGGSSGTLTYDGVVKLNFLGSNLFDGGTVFQLFDNGGIGTFAGDLTGIDPTTGATSPYAGLSFTAYASASAREKSYFNLEQGDWISDWTTGHQRLIFSQNHGTLTVVPEPSTIVFAGIGMAMFAWSTWTRRRALARQRLIASSVA